MDYAHGSLPPPPVVVQSRIRDDPKSVVKTPYTRSDAVRAAALSHRVGTRAGPWTAHVSSVRTCSGRVPMCLPFVCTIVPRAPSGLRHAAASRRLRIMYHAYRSRARPQTADDYRIPVGSSRVLMILYYILRRVRRLTDDLIIIFIFFFSY